jgi:hypothetical protein
MHWNYRVILHDEGQEPFVALHEVFYNEAGQPDGWSADPIHVQGDDLTELRDDLIHQLLALTKPVLRVQQGVDEDGDAIEFLVEVAE